MNRRTLIGGALLLPAAAVALTAGTLLRRPAGAAAERGRLRVCVINVGQGEATLLQTPNGGVALIGAGPAESGDAMIEALRNAGVQKIDLLILPYLLAEAVGGVPQLFDTFEVAWVLVAGASRVVGVADTLRLAHEQRTARAGDLFSFPSDRVTLEILAPEAMLSSASDADNSLVLRVRYGTTAFLFAGGIGAQGELALLGRAPEIAAQWLRVARSGDDAASSPEFLRLVNPEWAVISVGPNGEGFPGAGTLERLAATGAKLLRTDAGGGHNLVFWSDGERITTA